MSDDQMLREHQETFSGFIKISIWSTAFVVLVLVLMALFLL